MSDGTRAARGGILRIAHHPSPITKLYASTGSPFARKIRVMLIEKKAPHEVEMVDLWAPSDYQETNPVGKVPPPA